MEAINDLVKLIEGEKSNCHVGYLANVGKDESIANMYAGMNTAYGICLSAAKKIDFKVTHVKKTNIGELRSHGWGHGKYTPPPGYGNDDLYIECDQNGKPDFEKGFLFPERELRSLDLIKMH
jgi:hypothetical protein